VKFPSKIFLPDAEKQGILWHRFVLTFVPEVSMELIIFIIAAFLSYWYETEVFLFFASVFVAVRFFSRWYAPIRRAWPPGRSGGAKWTLGLLPAASFAIILVTLLTLASFDVAGLWVWFYIVLGYAWMRCGVSLLERFFDLRPAIDAIHLDNRAAIFPVAGGFLGITLIYAGANTGDGPGWWAVFIAGGIGLALWLLLAVVANSICGISERVTVGRDDGCGIRFGAYLLALGLILGRASGGDWISFGATLRDFMAGWPALPLTLLFIAVERIYIWRKRKVPVGL
jgi:hypothetical protein